LCGFSFKKARGGLDVCGREFRIWNLEFRRGWIFDVGSSRRGLSVAACLRTPKNAINIAIPPSLSLWVRASHGFIDLR
jgi:hypothetical protein